jgi:hypothetical protein
LEQLTVRGFDQELERRLRNLAREEGISLSRAALRLLRRGAGIEEPASTDRVGTELDEFIGDWSHEEERAFLRAVEATETVDSDLWK